jgi:hypothetical protein
MESEFLTWGNLITWVVCSVLLYLALNFRLYMIFHHPDKKLRARSRNRKRKTYSQGWRIDQCTNC